MFCDTRHVCARHEMVFDRVFIFRFYNFTPLILNEKLIACPKEGNLAGIDVGHIARSQPGKDTHVIFIQGLYGWKHVIKALVKLNQLGKVQQSAVGRAQKPVNMSQRMSCTQEPDRLFLRASPQEASKAANDFTQYSDRDRKSSMDRSSRADKKQSFHFLSCRIQLPVH